MLTVVSAIFEHDFCFHQFSGFTVPTRNHKLVGYQFANECKEYKFLSLKSIEIFAASLSTNRRLQATIATLTGRCWLLASVFLDQGNNQNPTFPTSLIIMSISFIKCLTKLCNACCKISGPPAPA